MRHLFAMLPVVGHNGWTAVNNEGAERRLRVLFA
jgi:hypothetical protein